ncbi:hypothetical protein GTPT_3002 [Tatumella ptyseos ATCC 33301]|uniref:Uncharacterized protein n=1 Tax=Tatumella ptyseos ATCC 33301 TaxID=1005995 RepID=A0A085JAU9_9GAMM|nr:hypothetical protein GTPT_3002 [Tatumella ptyseos ATCC 33301]
MRWVVIHRLFVLPAVTGNCHEAGNTVPLSRSPQEDQERVNAIQDRSREIKKAARNGLPFSE